MTLWDERFSEHGVFTAIDSVKAKLTESDEDELLSTVDLREAHDRLSYGLDYIVRVLSAADPQLTAQGPLNTLESQLTQVTSQIQNFLNTEQGSHLFSNANDHMDRALQAARQLPVPEVPTDLEGIRDDVTRFRQSASAHLRYLENDFKKAEETLEQKIATTSSGITKTETQIENRLQELNAEKQRLDKAIADFQQQFRSAEAERAKAFSDGVDKQGEEFRKLVGESETSLDHAMERFEAKGDSFIQHFEERKNEVEKLVGAVGATGLTGGFKATSQEEANQANFWRWVGVGAILAIVLVTVFLFGPVGVAPDWNLIAAKALVSAPFAVLAAYALTESAKHRRRESKNRKMALELASIDPYLALMPEDDQREVKKLLVERWFAQPDLVPEGDDVSKKNLLEIVSQALKVLGQKS